MTIILSQNQQTVFFSYSSIIPHIRFFFKGFFGFQTFDQYLYHIVRNEKGSALFCQKLSGTIVSLR